MKRTLTDNGNATNESLQKKNNNFKTENNEANQNMQDSKDKIDTTRTKYRRTCWHIS